MPATASRRLTHFSIVLTALTLGAWTCGPVSDLRANAHSDWGCAYCHVPHKAVTPDAITYGVPLWSPANTALGPLPTFTVYTSPAFDALGTGIVQPQGPSKLCLGCHDGSFWVSNIHTFGNSKAITLAGSHPISFVYNTALANNPKLHVAGGLKDPATSLSGLTATGTIATDLLDSKGMVQCTSCHDVHSAGLGDYHLRFNYDADSGKAMCRTCHTK